MSEEHQTKEIPLTEKLEKLGLDINQTPQVSYSDLRLDLFRDAGIFEGAFGKDGGETLWQAFNKNRTNFYTGNRWAQSMTPNGDISLLHTVPQSNHYNIFDIAKNGEIKMSRFTNGQWNWTIENAGGLSKTYTSSKGAVIWHFEDETKKTKSVFNQPSIGINNVQRVISYDKNTKQRTVSYRKVIDGKRVACDVEGNVLKEGTALMENLQNRQTAPHKFPSVADIKGVEKIDLYHGSRNFFENYDYSKARTVGGAQFGLGQYFTSKESMAYGYATLDKENPFIEKGMETNGEKVTTQKVIYHGELSGDDLKNILVPEKMTNLDYDVLIKKAEQQGKSDIVEALKKIKATVTNRDIDLCQWLRQPENVQFMQSAGINGVYSPNRDVYAIYDTSRMNIEIKEAVVLNGTEIPKSLIADKSIIHIQESLVEGKENLQILTTKGSILQRVGKVEDKNITAVIKTTEKNALKIAGQSIKEQAKKTATRAATSSALKTQAKNAAKSTGEALLKANAAYDKFFDDTMAQCMKLNESMPQWIQRGCNAVDKAMAKTVDNKVTRASAKKLEQAAEAFAKTKTGQKITEKFAAAAMKVGGKEAAASLAKKIPIVCLVAACYFAEERAKNGEGVKACGEILSGVCGCIPGPGTVASLAIDGSMLADDLKVAMGGTSSFEDFFEHGIIQADPYADMVAAESTRIKENLNSKLQQEKLANYIKETKEIKKAARKMAENDPDKIKKLVSQMPWGKYVEFAKNSKSK